MSRLYRRIQHAGEPPGSLEAPDNGSGRPARVTVLDYDEQHFQEKECSRISDCFPFRDTSTITWINVDGRDVGLIKEIGTHFNIHPLVLEDIFHLGQRAKVEDFGEYLFVVLKMLYPGTDGQDVFAEQISVLIGKNYVISFQETEGDVFDTIRERIRTGKGRIRKEKADYLAYALLDAIVDQYFVILEQIGEDIEDLEDRMLENWDWNMLRDLHGMKRDMIFLRKQIWPLREVLNTLQHGDSPLIAKSTLLFLRDVYDHTIQVMDTVEAFRDSLTGLHDIYLSTNSNRLNEVMKVLTMFATIFIPLTFLVGVYGMNFTYMPELKWHYGYFAVWALMIAITAGMIVYFKKKKWM